MDLGQNVFSGIGPLVEAVERADAVPLNCDTASRIESGLRQAPWSVGIIGKVLVHPSGRVDARFICHAGAESVIPEECGSPVLIIRVERIHFPVAVTVNAGAGVRHVVHAEGEQIFAGGVEVDSGVELPVGTVGGADQVLIKGDVGGGGIEIVCASTPVAARTWIRTSPVPRIEVS